MMTNEAEAAESEVEASYHNLKKTASPQDNFCCETCNVKFHKYNDWKDHIGGKEHQEKIYSALELWVEELKKERSYLVKVSNPRGTQPTLVKDSKSQSQNGDASAFNFNRTNSRIGNSGTVKSTSSSSSSSENGRTPHETARLRPQNSALRPKIEPLTGSDVIQYFYTNKGKVQDLCVSPDGNWFIMELSEDKLDKGRTRYSCKGNLMEITLVSKMEQKKLYNYLNLQYDEESEEENMKPPPKKMESSRKAVVAVRSSHVDKDNQYEKRLNNSMSSKLYQKIFKSASELDKHECLKSLAYAANQFSKLTYNEQVEIFINSTTLSNEGIETRQRLITTLRNILSSTFTSMTLESFGSFVTGLGDPDSDLDILMTDNSWSTRDMIFTVRNILRRARNFFDERQKLCAIVQGIMHARVPIIRFVEATTFITVDISFGNRLSVQNSKLIKYYLSLDNRFKILTLFVKCWASKRDFLGSQKIKSYALVLLVLVFLMKEGHIPTVHQLQTEVEERGEQLVIIDGWNASFSTNGQRISCKSQNGTCKKNVSVLELFMEFLRLYSTCEVENLVICPLTGEFLDRESFYNEYVEDLPPAFERYKNRGKFVKPLDISSPICIQDPFDLAFNVGALVEESVVQMFQSQCIIGLGRVKHEIETGCEFINLHALLEPY